MSRGELWASSHLSRFRTFSSMYQALVPTSTGENRPKLVISNMGRNGGLPQVIFHIAMHLYRSFTYKDYQRLLFEIAMLNYQRVSQISRKSRGIAMLKQWVWSSRKGLPGPDPALKLSGDKGWDKAGGMWRIWIWYTIWILNKWYPIQIPRCVSLFFTIT